MAPKKRGTTRRKTRGATKQRAGSKRAGRSPVRSNAKRGATGKNAASRTTTARKQAVKKTARTAAMKKAVSRVSRARATSARVIAGAVSGAKETLQSAVVAEQRLQADMFAAAREKLRDSAALEKLDDTRAQAVEKAGEVLDVLRHAVKRPGPNA